VDRAILEAADKPQFWLPLGLPTKSRSNYTQIRECVANNASRQYGDIGEDPKHELNLVVTSATRKTGATTLCDALKSEEFVSPPHCYEHLQGGHFNNDITVRWASAAIHKAPARVVLKELRCTATETPFSAGIYSKPNTATLVLIDLTDCLETQINGATARVRAIQKHHEAMLSSSTLVVGTKSCSPHRQIGFNEAYEFASSFNLPYVECDAHRHSVEEAFHVAVAMAAGLHELYMPSEFEGDAHIDFIEKQKASNLTAEAAPHFICGMLEELKIRAGELQSSP